MSDQEPEASSGEEQVDEESAVDQTEPSIEMSASYGDAAEPPDIDVPEEEQS